MSSDTPTKNALKGRELFIVDNSEEGWSGLRYLKDWTEIADQFDIATGYFEIGALLELDGQWQKLEKVRILMGDETTQRTKKAILSAIKSQAKSHLDQSIEAIKADNPFLAGVPAILEAIKTGQIECRIYNKTKFHAKAYITHAKMEIIGAQALVGSSNFTKPGLTQNVELNIQVQSSREVTQLQEWFETHWEQAVDISEEIINLISRHTHEFTPFDIYSKSLFEFFRGHELTAGEWDESGSKMFHSLGRYQQEAYWAMMKIAGRHGGAFLCDGVGLGKTFVGLMLIERLIIHENKRVVLFAPKGAKDGVWIPHLRKWLPHIGGVSGGADFSNLAVFSHTDLTREGEFPERFRRIAELSDVVIIDEAHHFRNPGKKGDEETGEKRSRYWKLRDLLEGSDRPKKLLMLTATPINNRLTDLRHMIELFSHGNDAYFGRTLGVNNLKAHFNAMEKALRRIVGENTLELSSVAMESEEFLAKDEIFSELVVQRSRAYAIESQKQEGGDVAVFPKRGIPRVAEYSVRKSYGALLDMFEKAFSKKTPLFSLPIYYPLAYFKGDETKVDDFQKGRQKQVVGLIRTQFLKRFESSVCAFELSCHRLLQKLVAFVKKNCATEAEEKRLERWLMQKEGTILKSRDRFLFSWEPDELIETEEDFLPDEFLETVEYLDRDEYRVEEILAETFLDMDQLVNFLAETRKFEPKNDDKLKKLIRLLNSKELAEQKVLVFTEFADTARYLRKQLLEAGIKGVEEIDGSTSGDRSIVIQRFAPYYNDCSSHELENSGRKEIRVLISTDVLSEGLNLQDATKLINYDIHWNPVRLMQRIGRVDRRMDPATEMRLTEEHPGVKDSRGKVAFWNFLPPDELNSILTLYSKVTHKTLVISKTLGIEGKKLITPDDNYDELKLFNEFEQGYLGSKSVTEDMHLEFQKLLKEDPELLNRLQAMPGSVFSGRKRVAKCSRGVFFCYSLPALDLELNEFSEEAGMTRWYLFDFDREKEQILDGVGEIISSIRSKPNTPRTCRTKPELLKDIRAKVEKHIKNTYLKRVDAPMGVAPVLKCWMELNEN